jgi:hypothetical protein
MQPEPIRLGGVESSSHIHDRRGQAKTGNPGKGGVSELV